MEDMLVVDNSHYTLLPPYPSAHTEHIRLFYRICSRDLRTFFFYFGR